MQCPMSNRTWVCLDCRKSFRRDVGVRRLACAQCGRACEEVDWKLHIPSPTKKKEWGAFWTQYLFEKRETARFHADPRIEQVDLPLLNRRLLRAKPGKKPTPGSKRPRAPGRSGRAR